MLISNIKFRIHLLNANAHHFSTQLAEIFDAVAESQQLGGAHKSEVGRIKDHDKELALIVRQ